MNEHGSAYAEVAKRLQGSQGLEDLLALSRLIGFCEVAGLTEVAAYLRACQDGSPGGEELMAARLEACVAYCKARAAGRKRPALLARAWRRGLPPEQAGLPANFLPFVSHDLDGWVASSAEPKALELAARDIRRRMGAGLVIIGQRPSAHAFEAVRQDLLVLEAKSRLVGFRWFFAAALCLIDELSTNPGRVPSAVLPECLKAIGESVEDIASGCGKVRPGHLSTLLAGLRPAMMRQPRASRLETLVSMIGIDALPDEAARATDDDCAKARQIFSSIQAMIEAVNEKVEPTAIATKLSFLPDVFRSLDGVEESSILASFQRLTRVIRIKVMRHENLSGENLSDLALSFALIDHALDLGLDDCAGIRARLDSCARLLSEPDPKDMPALRDGAFKKLKASAADRDRFLAIVLSNANSARFSVKEWIENREGDVETIASAIGRLSGGLAFCGLASLAYLAPWAEQAFRSIAAGDDPDQAKLVDALTLIGAALRGDITEIEATQKARFIIAPPDKACASDAYLDIAVQGDLVDIFVDELAQSHRRILEIATADLVGHVSPPGRIGNDPLTTLRRHFHTIKGGARLVLGSASAKVKSNLGELAWVVEHRINERIDSGSAFEQADLEVVQQASKLIEHAIEDLRLRGRCHCDWEHLGQISDDLPQPSLLATPQSDSQDEAAPVLLPEVEFAPALDPAQVTEADAAAANTGAAAILPEDETVLVAGKEVPQWLFESFSKDAMRLCRELRDDHEPMVAGGTATEELMRCAHSLGSVAQACGFTWVASLARQLESWANLAIASGGEVEQAERAPVSHAISRLAFATISVCQSTQICTLDDVDSVRKLIETRSGVPAAQAVVSPEPAAHTTGPDALLEEVEQPAAPTADAAALHLEEVLDQELPHEPSQAPGQEEVHEQGSQGDRPEPAAPALEAAEEHETADSDPLDEEDSGKPAWVLMEAARMAAAIEGQGAATEFDFLPPRQQGWLGLMSVDTQIEDSVDPDIFSCFAVEAQEAMPELSRAISSLMTGEDPDARASALRILHTLKGGARTAGAMRLGQVLHRVESHIEEHPEGFPESQLVDAQMLLDLIVEWVESVLESPDNSGMPFASPPVIIEEEHLPEPPARASTEPEPAATTIKPDRHAKSESVRVKSSIIERLISGLDNASLLHARERAEVLQARQIYQAMSDQIQGMEVLVRAIEIEAATRIQAVTKARESEFDPLEMDRFTRLQEISQMFSERLLDFRSTHAGLQGVIKTLSDIEDRRHVVEESMMRVAASALTIPVARLQERMARIIRQASAQTGKRAQLNLRGFADVNATMFERLASAIEHLVRNALAHGIESPQDRAAAGKPEMGTITLSASHSGGVIEITISDDGCGIDAEALKAKALEKGLLSPDEAASMTYEQAIELVFSSGLSTASKVSELAGRGVGMDAVRVSVHEIGGQVHVVSERGRGSSFVMRLPVDVSSVAVVPVRCAKSHYLVPISLVERFVVLGHDEARLALQSGRYQFDGRDLEVHALLAGDGETPRHGLIVSAGGNTAMICVDDCMECEQVIMKPVYHEVKAIGGVIGASLSASGEPMLVIDPWRYARHRVSGKPAQVKEAVRAGLLPREQRTFTVMVVDDSITVRTLNTRLVARNGFAHTEAKDGISALAKIDDGLVPDLFLLDIEMPNMDGFTLVRELRSRPATRATPIIMISSRTAEKYREKARECGANDYFSKPYTEEGLLDAIKYLLKIDAPAVAA